MKWGGHGPGGGVEETGADEGGEADGIEMRRRWTRGGEVADWRGEGTAAADWTRGRAAWAPSGTAWRKTTTSPRPSRSGGSSVEYGGLPIIEAQI